MSEYMSDLIRKRSQEQIEGDVALLKKSIKKAPVGDPSDKEMADIYRGIRRRRATK